MNLYKHPKLLEAFDLYVREQDNLLPGEEELTSISFSEEFQQRMRRMIARRKWGYYVLFGTAGRRAASIVVALLVASTITTVSVEALREPVSRFFAEVFEKFTAIFIVNDISVETTAEMELYAPTYVPEGYKVESETELDGLYRVTFVNNSGERIRYTQRKNLDVNRIIDTEGTKYSEIRVGEHLGIAYNNKNINTITYWNDVYTYTITGSHPQNELIKIANSITKKE